MNLDGKTIEDYFLGLKSDEIINQFPANFDYIGRYRSNASIMYRDVHPQIEKGAMIIDGGCLNNHGEKHIKTVIHRASQLISTKGLELSYYEIYVLLMSIHLHDVGNITGRKNHEQKIEQVIQIIETGTAKLDFEDGIEKECIEDIAEAHGGNPANIVHLDKDSKVLGHSVNKKQIASILRLADEISDDYTRADKILLQTGTLPPEIVIYHKYSFCLKTAEYVADSKIISYLFRVDEVDLKKKFPKKNKEGVTEEIYLIDEIYERTMKTFLELLFCSKFLRPHIQIDQVRVHIEINMEEKNKYDRNIVKSIQYDIDDLGYPTIDFSTLCPDSENLTGEILAQKLIDKTFDNVKFGNK